MTVKEIREIIDNLPNPRTYKHNDVRMPYFPPINHREPVKIGEPTTSVWYDVVFTKVLTQEGLEWDLREFKFLTSQPL